MLQQLQRPRKDLCLHRLTIRLNRQGKISRAVVAYMQKRRSVQSPGWEASMLYWVNSALQQLS